MFTGMTKGLWLMEIITLHQMVRCHKCDLITCKCFKGGIVNGDVDNSWISMHSSKSAEKYISGWFHTPFVGHK